MSPAGAGGSGPGSTHRPGAGRTPDATANPRPSDPAYPGRHGRSASTATHPRRRRRLRRHVRHPAPAQEAASRRGAGDGRRPAVVHDVPAVPARGRGRQHPAAPRGGSAASRAQGRHRAHRFGDGARPRASTRPPSSRSRARRTRSSTTTWSSLPGRSRARCPSPAWPRTPPGSSRSKRPSSCATACWSAWTSPSRRATQAMRERNLTFVVVGGGYAGIEALAELEDMSRYATRYYPSIEPSDLRWILVEASDRILPEVGPEMGRWTLEQLQDRGIRMALSTRLESCIDGHVVLSDGTHVRRRDHRLDGGCEVGAAGGRGWAAAGSPWPRAHRHHVAGDGVHRCLVRRRHRVGARPDVGRSRGHVQSVGAACGAAVGHARRQPGGGDAWVRPDRLPAQARGLGGRPRSLQGRGAGVRRSSSRASRPGSCTARTT